MRQHEEFEMDWTKYAAVGDVIECDVKHPCPQTIEMKLETPEACAYANNLLADENSGWRLKAATAA